MPEAAVRDVQEDVGEMFGLGGMEEPVGSCSLRGDGVEDDDGLECVVG